MLTLWGMTSGPLPGSTGILVPGVLTTVGTGCDLVVHGMVRVRSSNLSIVGAVMSYPDHDVLEKLKEMVHELVQIESFPPRHVDVPSVWVVRLGTGGKLYQLMYDNEYVAEGITGALQALIYEAIGRYQDLAKVPPPRV